MSSGTPWQVVPGGVALLVRLTPKGGRDAIEGAERLADGRCVVKARVRAAPREGEANDALVRLVAKVAGVPPRDVTLAGGASARVKRLIMELERVLKPQAALLVWEDVPARRPWNIIGHAVHRLDVGQHIRASESYRHLLSTRFHVERTSFFRSGFMDYGTYLCVKPSALATMLSDSQLFGVLPKDTDSSHDLAASC